MNNQLADIMRSDFALQFIDSLPRSPKEWLFLGILIIMVLVVYKLFKTFKKILISLLLIAMIAAGIYYGYFSYISKKVMNEEGKVLSPIDMIEKTKEAKQLLENARKARDDQIKKIENMK